MPKVTGCGIQKPHARDGRKPADLRGFTHMLAKCVRLPWAPGGGQTRMCRMEPRGGDAMYERSLCQK
jgi:hypothetical protein